MTTAVMTKVSQPPRANFSIEVMIEDRQADDEPDQMDRQVRFHFGSFARFRMKKRDMPSWDRENVRKTLIEYMTTRVVMLPRE